MAASATDDNKWAWPVMMVRTILFMFICGLHLQTQALDLGQCRMALGMQSGEIPDTALSASSSLDDPFPHGPTDSRIRNEANGGAWCPLNQVSKDNVEYLQIDLDSLKVITLIETQGRFGHGQGQEFTEQYLVEFQREDGGRWFRYRNRRGDELFQGNANTYMAELRDVSPPIIARRLRIIPHSTHPKRVCLRVELYGCPWKDGIVAYDMRQGDRRGNDLDLSDFTYDGSQAGSRVTGGLGQLTDGDEGSTNFRLDPTGSGRRGYEWVGWKSDSFPVGDAVEIQFRFDALRNFTSATVHANNAFGREVRVFRAASVQFDRDGADVSTSGGRLGPEVVEFEYLRDDALETARRVVIPLHNAVGRQATLRLHFDARWILISEVQFDSERVPESKLRQLNNDVETDNEDDLLDADRRGRPSNSDPSELDDDNDIAVGSTDLVTGSKQRNKTWRNNSSSSSWNDNNGRTGPPLSRDKVATPDGDVVQSGVYGGAADDSLRVVPGAPGRGGVGYVIVTSSNATSSSSDVTVTTARLDDRYIALIVGSLSALTLAVLAVVFAFFARHRRYTCMPISYMLPKFAVKTSSSTSDAPPVSKSFITLPYPTVTASNGAATAAALPPLPAGSDYANVTLPLASVTSDSDDCGTYATPPGATRERPHAWLMKTLGAVADRRRSSAGGKGKDSSARTLQGSFGCTEERLARQDGLRFLEKLGESRFGEVYLASVTVSSSSTLPQNKTRLVLVRTLASNADDHKRSEFVSEAHSLSLLDDINVAKVYVVTDDPPRVVLEYGDCGDLKSFLWQQGAAMATTADVLAFTLGHGAYQSRTAISGLSCGRLMYMASQIASAMNYLESAGFVHGDLAARNCLVTADCTVKVADLGRNQPRHQADYCRWHHYTGLPVRWMPWEALLLGNYSTPGDVWSFAVTVWEILTVGREQPYSQLSDEQVVANCAQAQRGTAICLPRPSSSATEIYDLMVECWNGDQARRPTFREIDMFLRRKTMGYRPELEDSGASTLPL